MITVHEIWLTQEADYDAKSWSSLKHVQPKEGRKELAPREIKFRYRLIPQSAIRERADSSQEIRKRAKDHAKDTRYPGLSSLFLYSFFSLFVILF